MIISLSSMEWHDMCKELCTKLNAELLFINDESCGIQLPNGGLAHLYIEEVMDLLS